MPVLEEIHDVRSLHKGELETVGPFDELTDEGQRMVHRLAVPVREKTLPQQKRRQLPWRHPSQYVVVCPMADAEQARERTRLVQGTPSGSRPRRAPDDSAPAGVSEDDPFVAEYLGASPGK